MQYHENTMNAYISLLDVKDVRIVKIALEASISLTAIPICSIFFIINTPKNQYADL